MIFPYTEKQKREFLKRFGQSVLIQDKEELAIVENEITTTDGQVSETIYITADVNKVQQEHKVQIHENIYEIAYIVNDGSGLVNCYLSLTGDTNGRNGKYV